MEADPLVVRVERDWIAYAMTVLSAVAAQLVVNVIA